MPLRGQPASFCHIGKNQTTARRNSSRRTAFTDTQFETVMLKTIWLVSRRSAEAFIDDRALSRGAAIAFYAVTSIGPVLLIVVAVAGLFFGEDAARGALMASSAHAMGPQSAGFLQLAIGSASIHKSGILATVIGVVSLIVTASGVFGEMQTALNAIWRAIRRHRCRATDQGPPDQPDPRGDSRHSCCWCRWSSAPRSPPSARL